MIRFSIATSGNIDSLIKLWSLCFGDDPKYLNRFFNHAFERAKIYIATDREEIISSLSVFYVSYCSISGDTIPGGYLYGVSTHPEHRGKQLSSLLLSYAKSELASENLEFLITRPAEESLFELYEKMGFNSSLYLSKKCVDIDEFLISPEIEAPQTLLASDFYSIREKYLKRHRISHIAWSNEMLDFIITDITNNGGLALRIGERYCIGYPEKDHIILLEHTFGEQIVDLIPYFKYRYPQSKTFTSFQPSRPNDISNERRYLATSLTKNQIAKRLSEENCYFNFPME